jgi:hypothetical protein
MKSLGEGHPDVNHNETVVLTFGLVTIGSARSTGECELTVIDVRSTVTRACGVSV